MVLCMDWENGATLPNYVRAAANTRLVGRQLAYLLKGLETHNSLNMSRVHLIGFSLGSHVAGFAGTELKGLHRITGLDPAGPLFEAQHPHARLDDSDAGFVDVIHSNGENLILGGLGSWQPMGAVDFYPNGGRVQHGCSNLFVGAVTDIIWGNLFNLSHCFVQNKPLQLLFSSPSLRGRTFPVQPSQGVQILHRLRCAKVSLPGVPLRQLRKLPQGRVLLVHSDRERDRNVGVRKYGLLR